MRQYDDVFEYGSNMLVNKIPFYYNNTQYMLWSWKGDYWNLQSGVLKKDKGFQSADEEDAYLASIHLTE